MYSFSSEAILLLDKLQSGVVSEDEFASEMLAISALYISRCEAHAVPRVDRTHVGCGRYDVLIAPTYVSARKVQEEPEYHVLVQTLCEYCNEFHPNSTCIPSRGRK